MYADGLSLEQSPPLKVILPFFITALFFLVVAVIVFFFSDIYILDRWSPSTIGLVHFFNLGFLVMAMMGVLTQMLPVLAGVTLPNVLWTSRVVHFLMTLGALFFPLGMIYSSHMMIRVGVLGVWIAICIFYINTLLALQKGIRSSTVTSFKISSVCALVTLVLAGRLAWGWTGWGEMAFYRTALIELHIAWVLFGMTFVLVMGVAYKVVPMFYVTPPPSFFLSNYASRIVLFFLLLWTLVFLSFIFEKYVWLQKIIPVIRIGLSLVVIYFSFEMLRQLSKRKRPVVDTTILYWTLSMILFSFAAFIYSLLPFFPDLIKLEILSTSCFGLAILSLVTGMFFKIIPFLLWFHLSAKGVKSGPTMRELFPDKLARKQFYLHLLMILSLFSCIFMPIFNYFFSFFLFCSLSMTLFLIFLSINTYRSLIK
jgi:hypothetical protein